MARILPTSRFGFIFVVSGWAVLLGAVPCRADWFDARWQYRRALAVNWDADHADGHELALAEFYAAGAKEDGSDIRVALENGRVIPSHVLQMGPGDIVRVVFALAPSVSGYEVYWGNANPAIPPPPAGTGDVKYESGLLMEMRQWRGRRPENMEGLLSDWNDLTSLAPGGPPAVVGKTLIGQPFYGLNPFGDQLHCMVKLRGALVVPVTGEYFFAGAAQQRGGVFIDGKPALWLPGIARDERFSARIALSRGRHEFVAYYTFQSDTGMISVLWRLPGMEKLEIIPRTAFGMFGHAKAGALEERQKPLTADFDIAYQGEYFIGGNYSHRYIFDAHAPAGSGVEPKKYDWDLGDGQVATGPTVEHVYLTAGVYAIKLTVHLAGQADTRTIRLAVDRDWANLDNPVEDPLLKTARIIEHYDVARAPENWLAWMAQIAREAQFHDAELAAAGRMAELARHADVSESLQTLEDVSHDLEIAGKTDRAVKMWERVGEQSDLQPAAAAYECELLTWRAADFAAALKVGGKFSDSVDARLRRAYAEALVLGGHADEGAKIFADLQAIGDNGIRAAAMSGAMARTIEFRIAQRDWENGEDDWENWEARSPTVFMEGYSVLLRTKLMEERGGTAAAAKVAEAFADAAPESAYAPALLDRAAKLVEKSDPAKAAELRKKMKERYPEDPLAGEGKQRE